MKNTHMLMVLLALGGLAAMFAPTEASAALGQREVSVTQDMGILSANSHTSSSYANFDVHEIATQGLRVKEYLSKSGTVFGVSWKGNNHPDLSLLLGEYFNDYSKALPHNVAGHPVRRKFRAAQSVIDAGSVIVEKSGHLRAMYGRAFAPGLIPAGVDQNEIK